ncbi:uncharacterized protein SPSC_04591 [Sporisorium scitamineum]|uniref:SCP2 domain-containing protein n=1 Tax=Sporisorium scitamineum TaxID=49012 RepID=A0A127ZF57_9BASI|nr:uncharacterized protein SPSC_04591 [Sporisorium scitamineum]
MSKPEERMKAEAIQALDTQEDLNCPGFESSRVFALSAQLLANPPAGFPSRKRLVRSLQSIYLFVIQPSTAIDPSNPRTKPVTGKASTSGGAFRPALWYADMKNKGHIGRGQPPKTVLGRKRKADVVIECRDRDFVDLATGKVQAQKLYNQGRIKIKGDLDRALRVATLISHERSKIYGTVEPAATTEAKVAAAEYEREGNDQRDADYGSGAPAPLPVRARL